MSEKVLPPSLVSVEWNCSEREREREEKRERAVFIILKP
jgi:hypothetical protein